MLSHEAAHYVAYLAFGFPSPVLHYGSAGYQNSGRFWQLIASGDLAAAAAVVPPWQAGAAAGAGIVATYVTVLACAWLVRRRPHPFLFGLGLVAPLRFLGSLVVVVATLLGNRGRSGSDEAHVASVFPVSELLLNLLGVAVLLISWPAILRALPQDGRAWRVTGLLTGIVVGGATYILGLGPLLLP